MVKSVPPVLLSIWNSKQSFITFCDSNKTMQYNCITILLLLPLLLLLSGSTSNFLPS